MTYWRCWARCRSESLPSDSDSTFVTWCEPRGCHWHHLLTNVTYELIWCAEHLYLKSVSPAVKAFAALTLFGRGTEASCTAIVRVRREERNWPSTCCLVCFTQAHRAVPRHLNRYTRTITNPLTDRLTCDVIRLEPFLPDTANIPIPSPTAPLDRLSHAVIAM